METTQRAGKLNKACQIKSNVSVFFVLCKVMLEQASNALKVEELKVEVQELRQWHSRTRREITDLSSSANKIFQQLREDLELMRSVPIGRPKTEMDGEEISSVST